MGNISISITQKEAKELKARLLAKQKGKCAICKRKAERPVLDHHHRKRIKGTGMIRGVLCNACNIFLAKAENNSVRYGISQIELPRILRSMADYLEAPQTNYLHPNEREKRKKLLKRSYNELKAIHEEYPIVDTKFPGYPNSGQINKNLMRLFKLYEIKPEFYS